MNSDWLRDPRPSDIEAIGNNLRQEDLIECLAQGRSGVQSLQKGVETSDIVQTAVYGSDPVGMLGVGAGGFIWLLGTPAMVKGAAAIRFLRECRKVLSQIEQRYPLLGNISWRGNTVHHKWLEGLGFTLDRDTPIEVNGLEHYYFWKKSHV